MIDLDVAPDPPPRSRALPRHVTWGLCGVAIGAIGTLAAGTVWSAHRTPAAPPPRLAAGPSPLRVDRQALADRADQDFRGGIFGPNVVASAPARIIEWPSVDARTVDDAHPAVDRGDYTLVVYCFGSGRVAIMLRVGPDVGELVAACGDAPGPTQVNLASVAGPMEVRISAIDAETVAVSYGVFRDA